jgi:hypothetical protein
MVFTFGLGGRACFGAVTTGAGGTRAEDATEVCEGCSEAMELVDEALEERASASFWSISIRSSASGGSLSSSNAFRARSITIRFSEVEYFHPPILILLYWDGWSSYVEGKVDIFRPTYLSV